MRTGGADGPVARAGCGPGGGDALVADLVRTREVRGMVASALPELLRTWAGTSRVRRWLAGLVSRAVLGGFAAPAAGERSLREVLQEPERARRVAAQAPALANGMLELACALGDGVAGLPAEDKARLVGDVVAAIDLGAAGRLLTRVATVASEARAAGQGGGPEALRPGIRAWVRSTDFGELKAALDALAADAEGFAGAVGEEMWQYPAKVTSLLSTIPAGVNAGLRATTKTLEPMNRLAPDLLADVLLALAREVQGEAIGRLVNETCELWRKTHTGSVLIGEQGRPQLPEDAARLIGEVLRTLDLRLVLKARALVAETGEATDAALCGLLEAHPELVREMLGAPLRRTAAASRRLARRTDLLERALSDDDLAGEVRAGLGAVDAQELGDTVSRLLAMLNALHAADPEALRGLLSQAVGALDAREVGRAARWLAEDLVEALRPLASEILPPVLRGLATLVAQHDGDVDRAMAALRDAVAAREEAA